MQKSGVKVNEVKDLKAFQSRMKPAYDLVVGKVGQPWMDKVLAAVKAAE
jgi:TRAP-type C4-dicarboxylate transport system substrate-binding protein